MWSLGDSPAVSVLLDEHECGYELKPAPRITKDMLYVHDQNERLIRWRICLLRFNCITADSRLRSYKQLQASNSTKTLPKGGVFVMTICIRRKAIEKLLLDQIVNLMLFSLKFLDQNIQTQ